MAKKILHWQNTYQIRNWLTTNIENSESKIISLEITKITLLILKRDIEKALTNEEYAKEMFPTTGYNPYDNTYYSYPDKKQYYQQLKDAVRDIDKIIQETDFNKEIIYYTEL